MTTLCLMELAAGSALAQVPTAIYVMQVDGSHVRKVAETPDFKSVGHARWSHDGKRLAFHGWDGPNGARRVFMCNADASQVPAAGPEGQLPDWSPDDKQLAFQTPGNGVTGVSSWVENIDGKGRTLLAEGSSPRWSPDGGRLAFIDGAELLIRNLIDDQQQSLTDQAWQGIRLGFDWSPDGRQIAFVARRDDGVLALWIADAKNPAPRLRLQADVMGHLAWSPDGKQLAITLDNMIQLLNADDDTPPRPIPGQIGSSRDPAWSPDGKWIAFSSNRPASGP